MTEHFAHDSPVAAIAGPPALVEEVSDRQPAGTDNRDFYQFRQRGMSFDQPKHKTHQGCRDYEQEQRANGLANQIENFT